MHLDLATVQANSAN